MHIEQFSGLMPYRVFEILLVATNYDAFILEEDGQLTELMLQEIRDLGINLRGSPRFVTADSGREGAGAAWPSSAFDLVVTTARLADMTRRGPSPGQAKALVPGCRWACWPCTPGRCRCWRTCATPAQVDWVFLWLGDVKSLFAMIKQQEDRRNADHDVLDRGVRAIIVVEDDVRFYSFFLPHIYAEVTHQTRAAHGRGAEPHAPDPAHAGPAQDPPGPDLRGGLGPVRALRRATCWASSPT